MSDKEEGELDSGEEEQPQQQQQQRPKTPPTKAAKTSDRVETPSITSPEKNSTTGREEMHLDGREFNDNFRKPRNVKKPPAFNEISNARQKFVSRRRFGSPSPSNRTHFDAPSIPSTIFTSTVVPVSHESSPPRPSDSWRQDPVPPNIFPIVVPRRPLLPLPNPNNIFPSQAASFFNNQQPLRSSFAPPPYRPANPTTSSFFNPASSDPRENRGPLSARQSIDMEISPIDSPLMTENCVMFVDEPLEESDDASTTTPAVEAPVLLHECTPAPMPYVTEPGMYIIPRNLPVEEPPPTKITAENPPPTTEQPSIEESPPPAKKIQKKFTKDLLQHIQSVLLESLGNELSSSSSSSEEFEEEIKEVDELRRKLIHHNKEMHDELDKRERLVKEMETCQLMINHHYERMNAIMRSIGDASRHSLRQARKSLSRTKSEGKRKRKKLCNNFENRVSTILSELSAIDEEVLIPPPVRNNDVINTTPEKPDETSELAEVLGSLIEDSGIEFNQSMEAVDVVETTPKRIDRELFVDKAFERECLNRMFQARFGVQPLPHIVVPSRRAAKRKKNSNASSVDVNLEREEALRRKLLEQMKKKEQQLFPSLHEKNKAVENEKSSSHKKPQQQIEMEGIEETSNAQNPVNIPTVSESVEDNAPSFVVKPFKSIADIPTIPQTVAESPKIVPTMKDIMELKKKIALSKRRTGNKRNNATTSSSPLKNSPVKQQISDGSVNSKTSSPIKFAAPLSKPMEKENVGNTGINQSKNSATTSENHEQIKKARLAAEEKSKRLEEFEIREQEILFNSPRVAVRNFILSPQYNIKESIERLRHKNDPNIELCYFELFGICNDDECPYQHQRDFTLNDQQILEEILGYIPQRVAAAASRSESLQKQAQKLLESNSLDAVIENLRKETSHLDLIKLAVDNTTTSV